MTASFDFDPLASHADPYPIYRRLRDEAPVHHNEQRGIWSVTRFDDVMHVLKTPEIFSSRAMFTMIMAGGNEKLPPLTPETLRFMWGIITKMRFNPLTFWKARNLIAEDGERHSSLRAIVNRGFTPRQIADWEAPDRGGGPRGGRGGRAVRGAAAARGAVRRGRRPRGARTRDDHRRDAGRPG